LEKGFLICYCDSCRQPRIKHETPRRRYALYRVLSSHKREVNYVVNASPKSIDKTNRQLITRASRIVSYRIKQHILYTLSQKRQTSHTSSYFHQILTDFKNSFTVTFSENFATKRPIKTSHNLNVSLHYLGKYIRTDRGHASMADRARKHQKARSVAILDVLVLSHKDHPEMHRSTSPLFSPPSWFEQTPVEDLTETIQSDLQHASFQISTRPSLQLVCYLHLIHYSH